MKRFVLVFALAVGLLTSASTLQAQVNMSRYITLTVTNGAAIRLNFMAAAAGTPVRIVSGSNTQTITVGTSWTGTATYTAGSTTMTVYGDLTGFDCDMNIANLTALDVSHNTQLTKLSCLSNSLSDLDVLHNTQLKYLNCSENQLTTLDVSGCTQLDELYCFNNTLNSLDVSGCTQLTTLWCYNNTLTSLDVSHNTQLTDLACSSNHLSSLDVSQNTQLTSLGCYNNNLSSLDVSQNTQLTKLWCYNNNFTTAALDDIFCALPDRTGNTNGKIQPIFNSSSSNYATVLATNKANATAKNWKVQYYDDDTDIPATTGSYVCGTPHPVDMSRYITLTVTNGAAIKLDLLAAAAGTPVRIVSGSNTQNITVGTSWYGTTSYTAGSTEMKVYGDIIGFDCSDNGANLTALDVSHNTQLRKLYCRDNSLSSLNVSKNTELKGLYCYGNSFSTSALDDIYCALPVRSASDNAEIVPVESTSAPNHATVIATNAQNATAKNWKVLYSNNSADITTTGSYVCPQLNMSRYITLTVTNGAAIKLDFAAASAGTPVRIVSGSNTQDITVGTNWYNGGNPSTYTVTADGTTMTIYGDLKDFACEDNGANLTALDPSHNTQLKTLDCSSNTLSSLDVTKNTQLTGLYCESNNLSSLDVSKNTQLTRLNCSSNTLTSLDVSKNTQLMALWCFSNTLSSLDVSKNTQLTLLNCSSNTLSSLDVSKNTQLTGLYCHGNNFSTAALDDIFCALPVRQASDNARIQPVYDSSSSNHAIVLATNKANAIAKNWKVQYYKNDADIPATTGSYVCSGGGTTTYDLKIAGVDVTSANCSDLSVIDSVSGTVKYDPTNKVLTLENATIQINTTNAIDSKIVDLTVKVIGTNNLTATLRVDRSATITGGGTLNVEIQNHCAIYANGTNLTINGCTVNAKGKWGIAGENGSSETLTIKNSTVTAEGASQGSIVDFASLTLDGCAITWPAGAAFDASLHAVALGGAKVTSKVVISPTGGEPNMDSYITLTVTNGAAIKLDFKAASAGTPVRIVSGSNTQDITVGTNWTGITSYTANASTMTIYGDLIGFDCQKNGANLTALDPSHNTQLTELYCGENTLSSLDVSKNTQLTRLDCQYNKLSSLDVSKNTQLTWLYCYNNTLGNLDVSKNTQLDMLDCSSNTLSSLDVSHNTQLTRLDCSSNTLSSLDVSKNTQLQKLICHGNKFSAQALDDIYCALPDRTSETNGVIQPVYSDTSSNHAIVLATNKANAIAKNWNVQYYKNNSDIPATTGKHKCSTTDIAEAATEQALTLYPNPVADVLYLSATARTIRVYDMYGTEVAHATDTDRVEVSHLPAGVYMVKADGTVAKMVKR